MSQAIATNSMAAWILASRPKTLGAVFCPIMIGSALALAQGFFLPRYFMMTMLCSVLLQVLANLINDYGDFIKGSDTKERLGPPRAMQMGYLTLPVMKMGIAVVLLLIIMLGILLVERGGWPIFFMGLLGIFLCGFYTLGSKPLAYLGFAEVVILVVFGPMAVMGAYYIETRSFSSETIWASLTPGFLATALILTNNLRDVVEDTKNNKRTIAVRFGHKFARVCIAVLILLALSGPIGLLLVYSYSPWVLMACLPIIVPVRYIPMILWEPISARFNLMLMAIGKTLYLAGIMFFLGILYGAP